MAKKKGIDVNGVILVIVIVLVVGLSLGIFYKAPVGEAGEGELAQMRPNANVPLTLDELRNGIYLKRRTTITWTESLDDVPVGNAFKGIMGDLDYIIRPKGRDRYWYNPNYYPDKNNINIKKERFFSKL